MKLNEATQIKRFIIIFYLWKKCFFSDSNLIIKIYSWLKFSYALVFFWDHQKCLILFSCFPWSPWPMVRVLLGTTVFKKSLTPMCSNSIQGNRSSIASLKKTQICQRCHSNILIKILSNLYLLYHIFTNPYIM